MAGKSALPSPKLPSYRTLSLDVPSSVMLAVVVRLLTMAVRYSEFGEPASGVAVPWIKPTYVLAVKSAGNFAVTNIASG